jgi:c-di-GMP-related signal transduction protein
LERFMARQPILDRDTQLYAYELLFRSGPDSAFGNPDPDKATARVIVDTLLTLGLGEVAGDRRVFINLTHDLLIQDVTLLLPPEQVVVEVLETVEPDAEVIAACRRLKDAGFLIALDDFVPRPAMARLVDLADIIKVDLMATKQADWRTMAKQYSARGIKMLAEKVETQEDFRTALDAGYDYYQGYFFARPAILRGHGIPELSLTHIQLLSEAVRPDPDFQVLARIIRGDVSLSYKLLRFINSPSFGLRRHVDSIRDALSLLGDREVRRWACLLAMANMGIDRPSALVEEAAVRARLCELMAAAAGHHREADRLFLVGLFSLIDAILDRPLSEILAEVSLPPEVRAPLLGEPGWEREILACAVAYMKGDWASFGARLGATGVLEDRIPDLHRDALAWMRQALDPSYEAGAVERVM